MDTISPRPTRPTHRVRSERLRRALLLLAGVALLAPASASAGGRGGDAGRARGADAGPEAVAEPVGAQTTPPELLRPDLEPASRPNRALQLGLGILAGALVGGGGAVAVWQTLQADCVDELECDLEARAWTVGAATLGWTLGAAWGVWLGGLSGDWRGSFALTLLSALGGVVLGAGVTVGLALLESSLAVPAAVVGGLLMPLGAAYLGYRASEQPPWTGPGEGPGERGRIAAAPGGVLVRFF